MTRPLKASMEIAVVFLFRLGNSRKISRKAWMTPMKIALHHRPIHLIYRVLATRA